MQEWKRMVSTWQKSLKRFDGKCRQLVTIVTLIMGSDIFKIILSYKRHALLKTIIPTQEWPDRLLVALSQKPLAQITNTEKAHRRWMNAVYLCPRKTSLTTPGRNSRVSQQVSAQQASSRGRITCLETHICIFSFQTSSTPRTCLGLRRHLGKQDDNRLCTLSKPQAKLRPCPRCALAQAAPSSSEQEAQRNLPWT